MLSLIISFYYYLVNSFKSILIIFYSKMLANLFLLTVLITQGNTKKGNSKIERFEAIHSRSSSTIILAPSTKPSGKIRLAIGQISSSVGSSAQRSTTSAQPLPDSSGSPIVSSRDFAHCPPGLTFNRSLRSCCPCATENKIF